ncbi:uncharacterized protein NPIL_530831 [Nephila pilipes]|uniref:Uncharacterized protein n=1 Tax=Nephila pilipes TaxID=299642 RepID=A0A8X6TLQ3_NEPPI|nr:uncharacterized protein NPIL_530831 [Nephila pilipes]
MDRQSGSEFAQKWNTRFPSPVSQRKNEPQVNAWKKIFALLEIYDLDIFVRCHRYSGALATMMGKRGVRPCRSSALRRRSVVLLLLCVVMVTGEILRNDPKCLSIGGLCVDLDSCPAESRSSEPGLCAQDGPKTGVCCFRTPDDADCRQRGGRCGSDRECQNVQNFGQLDCEEGTRCCLLIY